MQYRLSDIIDVQPGFKAAVDILQDLENHDKIRGYIPTENGVKVIEQVFDYLRPHISTLPIILTGTYGTGKSHLGLVISTLLRKSLNDKLFNSLLDKVKSKWKSTEEKIKYNKENYGEKPYLIVYLEAEEQIDWGRGFFDYSLILALRNALKRENIEDFTPKTTYDIALKRIEEIRQKYPDDYKHLEKEVANTEYFTVESLEHKLRKFNKEALKDFDIIHKKVSAGAIFDWFSGVSASDAYVATVETLGDKGYKGILLIWDEFTPVLRNLVEHPQSGESLAFQKFAQTCESSGSKILSLFISIRDIPDMVDRVIVDTFRDESLKKDVEKISARFRSLKLGTIDKETYQLMRNIIVHKDEMNNVKQKHNERFSEVKNGIDKLHLFDRYQLKEEDKKIISEDLYPLHPLTTLILSRLTDRVGQKTRTIFTFLCDTGVSEGNFNNFLESKEVSDTHLPFLYPFDLESYFLPLIRQSQDYKELKSLVRKYEETLASLSPDDSEGEKIIKAIFLLIAADINADTKHLFFSLGCIAKSDQEKIYNKLEFLKNEKKITQKYSDKSWRFYGQSFDITTMDEHIREVKNEVVTRYTDKELFNGVLNQIRVKEVYRSIEADRYNIDRSMNRKLHLEFIQAQELNNPESLRRKIRERYFDGAYYVILTYTEEELFAAKQKVQQDFSTDRNTLFALPGGTDTFEKIIPSLRHLKTLEILPSKYSQYQNESREELDAQRDEIRSHLKNEFDELLDPAKGYIEFYYLGEKKEIKAVNRLREIVSEMMEKTFPDTPSIAREELIDETGNDSLRSRYRIPIINVVLSPNAPSLLTQETESFKRHIIEVLYKHHNILRREEGKWIIGKPESSPENNAMIKIWEEIDNFVRTNTYREFTELIEVLRLPPYGLKLRTIGLILAPVLREYVLHDNLILEGKKKQPIDTIDGELIETKIVSTPQQIKVRFQEITEKHKVILTAIANTFNSTKTDLESVFRTVVNWWRDLPPYSRNTQRTSEKAKILKDRFFQPLSSQEKVKGEMFYSILPHLIGIEELSRKTDQEVETITKENMTQIKAEFEELIFKLHQDIESAVIETFGMRENVMSYYSDLPEEIQQQVFTGDEGKLMVWLKEINSAKRAELENFVALAEKIGNLGKCDNWSDEQVFKLKGHLESAKNRIESYTTDTTSSVLPTKLPAGVREDSNRRIFEIGDVKRLFTLYENLRETPNKDQVQILYNFLQGGLSPFLKNGQITGDEFFSILYHLVKEAEKND